MTSLTSYLSIISLTVNGLNAPVKCHRVADWIKRHDSSISCLQETHFEPKDTTRLKVEVWGTIFHANGPQKKAGLAILISGRSDFKLETIVRDTEGTILFFFYFNDFLYHYVSHQTEHLRFPM